MGTKAVESTGTVTKEGEKVNTTKRARPLTGIEAVWDRIDDYTAGILVAVAMAALLIPLAVVVNSVWHLR